MNHHGIRSDQINPGLRMDSSAADVTSDSHYFSRQVANRQGVARPETLAV
jgi:hypothetical protein